MNHILEGLFVHTDTANTYVLRSSGGVVLVDCGDGSVFDALEDRVTDVLVTHHHRDGTQGLARAAAHGARIHVPEFERHLLETPDRFWARYEPYSNYSSREDRYSPLESVPVSSVLLDHEVRTFGNLEITVLPTPGHTSGAVSFLTTIAGARVAFVGDLIHASGKLWSLAATQWSYNGGEGLAATVLSLLKLRDLEPDVLLPAHSEPIWDVRAAIDATVDKLLELLRLRRHNPRLLELRAKPFEAVTPHVLMNRTSFATHYIVLSDSGKALFVDFGFDFVVGDVIDSLARRPSVYHLETLKRDHGVRSVEAVIPTHYHDDHVAGLNLLRRVTGAQVWAPQIFSDILKQPARFNLPCLWFQPIAVNRRLPLETPIQWEEHTLTLHALPGHTRHAVAISLNVDGERIVFTGDQYSDADGLGLNYVYGNEFSPGDYVRSAQVFARLEPTLILTGHWAPQRVEPGYVQAILERGRDLERLHRALLPETAFNLGSSGFVARLEPYQQTVVAGEAFWLEVRLANPFDAPCTARIRPVAFGSVRVEDKPLEVTLEPLGSTTLEFMAHARLEAVRRARVTVDVTVGDRRFGQIGEALVDVVETERNDQ